MLTRRNLLLALGSATLSAPALVAAPALGGCSRPRQAAPSWPRTSTYEGVEMIELFPNGADESSPLVVAIHGMGDRPERWVDDWKTFPGRAEIVLPRAFDAYGGGFSWFPLAEGMTDAELGAAVGGAEERLWKAITKARGTRRVIVTGFSQGGILSFAIAARHSAELLHAFPVSGSCPGPLLPQKGVRAAPIAAFHGSADRVLDVKWGREAVNAFKERGNEATLREYEGVGHTVSPEMRHDVFAAIEALLPRS